MENAVILSQKEYDSLQRIIKSKDESIKKLKEIIDTDEKYIVIESINSLLRDAFTKEWILDYPRVNTPKEFKEDAERIINQFKNMLEDAKKETDKRKKEKWYNNILIKHYQNISQLKIFYRDNLKI